MHLLGAAYQVGYQNSGITPSRRHMLAIRSTHKIDTPVAYVENDQIHSLVDPAYLYLLLTMSNGKFKQNMDRLKVFEDTMRQELHKVKEQENWESKEARRERKRMEGLKLKEETTKKAQQDTTVELEDLLENVVL